MPLLISGPPGAPLTDIALQRFCDTPGALYLVPTATMAEHLRHSLVRTGHALRPNSIQTLAAFLDQWSPLPAASPADLYFAMERALARLLPFRFRDVADFPGVIHALADLCGQISGTRTQDDVGRLLLEAERDLASRNLAPRHARLDAAARRIAQGSEPLPGHIFFDGFFKFAAGESALLGALTSRAEVTVALPSWPGAESIRETLLAAGFSEQAVTPHPPAPVTAIRALNIEREVEDIARQILEQAERGRAFREIGIIVRSRERYGPLLETTLARFGIPFRAYFSDSAASHPYVQFLSQLCRAALAGWDHELLLPALRSAASGLGGTKAGDELDFHLRQRLPNRGWAQDSGLNTADRLEPSEWSARLQALHSWAPELNVSDRASLDRIQAWRSIAAARSAWDEAVAAASLTLQGRFTLADFWTHAETVLKLEQLRVPDARRNVVHLLDAYEARQWSLPVVFVCGLTERYFPKYHSEDPIVGDLVLRLAGLETKADREREERFLFQLATTRATARTVLSYPQFDEQGQETLPSFFLQGVSVVEAGNPVRPAPRVQVPVSRPVVAMRDATLYPRIAEQFTRLSASAVEKYLQCAFPFFVQRTLGAKERPKAPRDRLNYLLQGSILHEALAEWTRRPFLDTAALDGAFDTACSKERVPPTYRAEAVRLELLRHFESFISDTQVQLGWESRIEESFEFSLREGVSLRGRIDRLDVNSSGLALVIDYKYSAADKVKARVEDSESGDLVQAGVYLLAAERSFGLTPAGMLFCAVKKGVHWDGWHASIPGLDKIGERRTATDIAGLAREAEQTVLRVYDEITHGRIAVQPKDPSKCSYCECRDICRVESIAQVREMTA